ncbi:MAG: FHA domain-containing protein [Lachnospiraceae bacterium]|nr:FHA domain-containing protein [Lachnospiraceae bacterium]
MDGGLAMNSKKSLIFGSIMVVLLVCGFVTMFMPYIKITSSDLIHATKAVFGDLEKYIGDIIDDSSDEWIESETGIGIVDNLLDLELDNSSKHIKRVKTFVLTCLFIAWGLTLVTVVLTIVLKKRYKYIITLLLSIGSAVAMLCIFIFLPNVVSDAIVVGVEEQIMGDVEDNVGEEGVAVLEFGLDEALDLVGGEGIRDTVISWIGEFVRELLNRTLTYGYWLYITLMGATAIVSIIGLILDTKKLMAKIYVLSGAYKGARIDVDSNIIVGRDPNTCQLIMDGEQVSRKHCKISFNPKTGKYLVTDYSTNGTYYTNGKRLDENVTSELDSGTIILIGKNGDKLKLG